MSDPISIQEEILKLKRSELKLQHYYIDFQLANLEYAIDMDYIIEIRPYLETDIMPIYAPTFILGMAYLNGRLVPIYSFMVFSGVPDEPVDINKKVILLLEIKNEMIGFLVDAIIGIVEINTDQLLYPANEIQNVGFFSNFIRNNVLLDGRNVLVLDPEKLFINNPFFSEHPCEASS